MAWPVFFFNFVILKIWWFFQEINKISWIYTRNIFLNCKFLVLKWQKLYSKTTVDTSSSKTYVCIGFLKTYCCFHSVAIWHIINALKKIQAWTARILSSGWKKWIHKIFNFPTLKLPNLATSSYGPVKPLLVMMPTVRPGMLVNPLKWHKSIIHKIVYFQGFTLLLKRCM
jgi:hypothetical protein